MKIIYLLCFLFISSNIFSIELLGLDSGGESIELYQNEGLSNRAILILGGIHGDEIDTFHVVNYLKDEFESNIKCFFIPSLQPTLRIENRRGYLREQLDSEGYVIPGNNLQDYNKSLYYRIFYGNNSTYNNGINHYIDPNRDFIEQYLPSTRILISLINKLKSEYKEVVVVSFHGYMSGGRIYPEYSLINNQVVVDDNTWKLTKAFEEGSFFKAEKVYSPAITILDRFRGELIAYTGLIENVTGMDVELNSNERELNKIRSLNGIKQIEEILLQQK